MLRLWRGCRCCWRTGCWRYHRERYSQQSTALLCPGTRVCIVHPLRRALSGRLSRWLLVTPPDCIRCLRESDSLEPSTLCLPLNQLALRLLPLSTRQSASTPRFGSLAFGGTRFFSLAEPGFYGAYY